MANKYTEAATNYAINARRIASGRTAARTVIRNRFTKSAIKHADDVDILNQNLADSKQEQLRKIQAIKTSFFDMTSAVLNKEALAQLRAHSLIAAPTFTSIYSGFEHARASQAERLEARVESIEKANAEYNVVEDARLTSDKALLDNRLKIQEQNRDADLQAVNDTAASEQAINTRSANAQDKDIAAQARLVEAQARLDEAQARRTTKVEDPKSSVSEFFRAGGSSSSNTGGSTTSRSGGIDVGASGTGVASEALSDANYTPYQLRRERNILRQLSRIEGGVNGVLATNLGNNEAGAPRIKQGATIAEVQAMQANGDFAAAGAYQIIPQTLNGLVKNYGIDTSLDFTDPAVQADLARLLIREKRGLMESIENTEKATTQNLLHELWRAVPTSVDGVVQVADRGSDRQLVGAQADNFYESTFDGIGEGKNLFDENEDATTAAVPATTNSADLLQVNDTEAGISSATGDRLGVDLVDDASGITVRVQNVSVDPLTGTVVGVDTPLGVTDVDSGIAKQVIAQRASAMYTEAASRGMTIIATPEGNVEVPINEVSTPEALEKYGVSADAVAAGVARHNAIASATNLTAGNEVTLSNGAIISTENLRLAKEISGAINGGIPIKEIQSNDFLFDGRTPTAEEAEALTVQMKKDRDDGVISFITTSGQKTTISQEEANQLIPDGGMHLIDALPNRREQFAIDAREAEAKRIADEAEEKRIADEAEAKRIADEAEEKRIADEAEEKRIADEAEEKRIADGEDL